MSVPPIPVRTLVSVWMMWAGTNAIAEMDSQVIHRVVKEYSKLSTR